VLRLYTKAQLLKQLITKEMSITALPCSLRAVFTIQLVNKGHAHQLYEKTTWIRHDFNLCMVKANNILQELLSLEFITKVCWDRQRVYQMIGTYYCFMAIDKTTFHYVKVIQLQM